MSLSIVLLFIGSIVLTAGDLVMKKWVVTNSGFLYFAGLSIYLLGLVFLVETFKYKNVAVASTIFVIFNVIILALVSWVYYKETLSIMQIAGIIMGIFSVVLLEMSQKS